MATSTQSASNLVPDVVRIGEWTFRANVFRLKCGQNIIKLEPRVAKLLTCLVENAGTVVSREYLMEKVWPGTVVGDEAITNAINKLRKAFGDDRQNPQVIETIPKAGYRLIAKVEPIESSVPIVDEEPTGNVHSANKHGVHISNPIILLFAALLFIFALWL